MKIALKLPKILLMALLMMTSTFVVAGPDGNCTKGTETIAQNNVLSNDGTLRLNAIVQKYITICDGPEHAVVRLDVRVERVDGVPEVLFLEAKVIASDDQGNVVETNNDDVFSIRFRTYVADEVSNLEVHVEGFDPFEFNF